MKRRFFAVIIASLIFPPQISTAGYDANMKGIVTAVVTYTNGDHIYFRLHNQPSSHPTCKTDYFAIDPATPPDRLNRMLSRLLTAYTSGETVNVGYDSQGDCTKGRIRVYRIG